MANKLKEVFNKNESFLKLNIKFKDADSYNEFSNSLDTVYKEGKAVRVGGVNSLAVGIDSGTGVLPYERMDEVLEVVVGPYSEKVVISLKINDEIIDFPVKRTRIEDGLRIETLSDHIFQTTIEFNEKLMIANVSIKPNLKDAPNVECILKSIEIEKAYLIRFFAIDLQKGTDLNSVMAQLDEVYDLFDRLHFVEKTCEKQFAPASIDLNDVESQRDLIELCLALRDKKAVRTNAKMDDTIAEDIKLADEKTVIEGMEISMTFMWELEYSIWGEKVRLFCANLLNNAIVESIENLADGKVRVRYGEKTTNPMYISYKAFLSEDEAHKELQSIADHKEEYINAKTVEQYMAKRKA